MTPTAIPAATGGKALFMPECYEPPPNMPAIERADSTGWHLPVAQVGNNAVLSHFGAPRDRGARSHAGIDIAASRGALVHAPLDARVITSRNSGRGGNTVVLLDASEKIQFVFTHLDSRAVSAGEHVLSGQQIGAVGTTGNAAGGVPHLHFEVHDFAGPIDPCPLLDRAPGASVSCPAELAAR
ncbi:MAG TPA: M23 family metallopeptidase [Acidobacteriota bacterium]|nr:M23 family metallopeptidase [Acidobacteriota bacterium]